MVPLLINGSATGDWELVKPGGRFVFSVVGTFNGATITLQFRGADNSTAVNVTSGSFTAAGALAVDVGHGSYARVFISGGPPSAVYAVLTEA